MTTVFPWANEIDKPWANVSQSSNSWASYSLYFGGGIEDPSFLHLTYFVIAYSVAILLHSILINKNKFPVVRIATGRTFFDKFLPSSSAYY